MFRAIPSCSAPRVQPFDNLLEGSGSGRWRPVREQRMRWARGMGWSQTKHKVVKNMFGHSCGCFVPFLMVLKVVAHAKEQEIVLADACAMFTNSENLSIHDVWNFPSRQYEGVCWTILLRTTSGNSNECSTMQCTFEL